MKIKLHECKFSDCHLQPPNIDTYIQLLLEGCLSEQRLCGVSCRKPRCDPIPPTMSFEILNCDESLYSKAAVLRGVSVSAGFSWKSFLI